MLRVGVLGELTVEVDGGPLAAVQGSRARALLGWLALHPGLHPRGELAARFWPDVLDSSARASLRSAAWALRSALGPAARHLVASRERIGLDDAAGLWVDAREFAALAEDGRAQDALALCRGDLLAGLEDEWVLSAREEHRERVAALLARLADAAEAAGDGEGALAWARRLVAHEPLGEDAHRRLMRLLAAAGDRPAALAVYDRLSRRLRNELAIAPSARTRAEAEALRGGEEPAGAEAAAPGPPDATAAAPAAAPLAAGPPLVGRDRELAELRAAWEAARGGGGRAVVVEGEGGIGKSRLVAELAATAAGARVATCAALEFGGAPPLAMWAELLGALAAGLDSDQLAAWPADLGRLSPRLARRLGAATPAPAGEMAPELERTRLYEATIEALEAAAGCAPLLLVMEDLHLADGPSLELAAYAGRRIGALPVLLVLTRRELPRRPEGDALLHALRARGLLAAEVALGPLEPEAVAALARSVAPLDPGDVERVVGAAEGNALLAVESARALARGDREPPAGLRAATRAAYQTLDGSARLVVDLLAVAGRELERGELPAEGAGAATAAVDCGLCTARAGRLGFRHALLREAAYADLPEPRRTWLHEQLAAALDGSDGASHGSEIARHLRAAGRDADAVPHLARAARDARAVGALPAAADYLEEAIALAPGRADLLLDLADVRAWEGRHDAALALFDRTVASLDPDDSAGLVDAWLRRGRWFHGSLCAPLRARHAYQTAIDLMGDDAPVARRAEALAGVAWGEAMAGDVERVDVLLREIHELVGPSGGGDVLALEVGHARATSLIRRGLFTESYAPAVAAADAAERLGRPDNAYAAWSDAAGAAAAVYDFERSLGFVDRALERLSAHGPSVQNFEMLAARTHLLVRMGRFEEARATVARQETLADAIDHDGFRATADHDAGLLALATGAYGEAAARLERALDGHALVSRPLARLARAEALARAGRPDEADAELREVVLEPVRAADFPDTLVPRLTRVQGLVAAARGDLATARARLEEAETGWRRLRPSVADGDRFVSILVDLARPPMAGMVEPERELQRVLDDLAAIEQPVPAT